MWLNVTWRQCPVCVQSSYIGRSCVGSLLPLHVARDFHSQKPATWNKWRKSTISEIAVTHTHTHTQRQQPEAQRLRRWLEWNQVNHYCDSLFDYCTSSGWEKMIVVRLVEWMSGRGNRSVRRKHAPVPLCPPQIPHDDRRQKPACRNGKPGTDRLTYGTALSTQSKKWPG
jgi:hypothetical protein